MPNKRKIIADSCGDAIVEAAILFPVMIMIFSALALLAVYLPARSALQRATQFAATAIATECSDTWLFFDAGSMSFYWAENKDSLKNVYASAFPDRGPMRAKAEETAEKEESRNLSSKAGDLTVDCLIVNRILYEEIIVTASRKLALPVDLSIIGIPGGISITVTSTAVVQNADEFIRNVDLAAGFAGYILEKFGLTDIASSIGAFGDKVASLLGLKK